MSLSRNVAYNIAINILNILIPIITVPYVSRVLGVENIGIVTFATTYAAYFTLFITLGIPIYGVREIGKLKNDQGERNKVVSELTGIVSFSTLLFSAIYVITVFAIPTLRSEWEFLLVAGVGLLFAPLSVDWYFIGRENLKVIAIRSIVARFIGLTALFIFVTEREDLLPYIIINIFLVCGSQIWNFYYMLRTEVKLTLVGLNFRRHLKPVLILFLSSLAISIYTMLDTLMLGFMSSYTEVGYYTSAIKISRLVLPVVTAAAMATIPRISQLYKEQDFDELQRVAGQSFNFMSLLAPPLTIGLIVIAPVFVPMFFGAEFLGVVPSMMIISFVVLLIGINNFYGPQILISSGKDKAFMYAVLLGTISNFILNLFFIPAWGSVGAASASVIAESIVTGAVIIYASRLVPQIKPSYRTMVQSIIASLPMIFFGWFFAQIIESNLWATLFVAGSSGIAFVLIEILIFKDKTFAIIANKILPRVGLTLKYKNEK